MVKTPGRALTVALGLAIGLTEAPLAGAHAEWVPTLVNRYVSLTVFEARVDVLVSLLFGQLPAGERRRTMDSDGNGLIEPRELQRERMLWAASAGRAIRIFVDGSPVTFTPTAVVDLSGETSVKAVPMLVTLQGSLDLDPGKRALRIEAGPDLPRLGETEMALDITSGWTLTGSLDQDGKPGRTGQRLFQFPAPRTAQGRAPAVTFSLRGSGGAGPAGRALGLAAWALIALSAAAVAGLTLVAVRARRAQIAGRRR